MPPGYSIKEGDSLTRLAKRFGTTVSELAKANNIEDPDKIYVGDNLIVPDKTMSQGPTNPAELQALLKQLSSQTGTSVEELMQGVQAGMQGAPRPGVPQGQPQGGLGALQFPPQMGQRPPGMPPQMAPQGMGQPGMPPQGAPRAMPPQGMPPQQPMSNPGMGQRPPQTMPQGGPMQQGPLAMMFGGGRR